jgi:hypothetical protein
MPTACVADSSPDGDSSYVRCKHARRVENQGECADTAVLLTSDLKEFRSAIPINDFLTRHLLLFAHQKISPRRAAVLAYITNQLLRTLPAIDRELNPTPGKNEPVEFIFDMPGPNHDPDRNVDASNRSPQPEPTYANTRTGTCAPAC